MKSPERMAEADKLMKSGDKAVKKTLFKWTPDWDTAAANYDKAGGIYRVANEMDKACYAYEKAADAHYKNNIMGFAARALENVASIKRDQKQYEASADFYKKCSDIFVLNESYDKGSECLVKAAKIMCDIRIDLGIQLYKDALSIYEVNDRHAMMGDTWRQALAAMLKAEMWTEALELLERLLPTFVKLEQMPYHHRACLSILILKLQMNDYPAADKLFMDFCASDTGFAFSDEGKAAEGLLQAFDKGEVEEVEKMTKGQPFTFLENMMGRVAKGLHKVCMKKEGLGGGASRPAGVAPGEGGAAAEAAGDEDDDELL
mmetsp:Transcript_21211/g.49796  ORF Transcript_21211/g.49796 Transcript_21211/m.49796 type:complete len:317 (+) Transcript_21211:22-972(+)